MVALDDGGRCLTRRTRVRALIRWIKTYASANLRGRRLRIAVIRRSNKGDLSPLLGRLLALAPWRPGELQIVVSNHALQTAHGSALARSYFTRCQQERKALAQT